MTACVIWSGSDFNIGDPLRAFLIEIECQTLGKADLRLMIRLVQASRPRATLAESTKRSENWLLEIQEVLMLILNAEEVRQSLPMPVAVQAMKQAFKAISTDQVNMPVRIHIDFPKRVGTTLVMPAHVQAPENEALAVKVVSVFGNNPKRNLPRILAIVNVFDPETGRPIALLEGTALTQIRTAAASAAATNLLARQDCQSLAIIGAGVQARSHIEAIAGVRSIREIRISSRSRESCERLVQEVRQKIPEYCRMEIFDDANQAVSGADIVCTVSTATDPLFSPESIRPGTHINAVGSYQPRVVEIPGEVVHGARVFVDHLESALEEAGDLIQPIRNGLIARDHIMGEIGQVISGEINGRTSNEQITLFKSVGNAVEDCLAANAAIKGAHQRNLGTNIPW